MFTFPELYHSANRLSAEAQSTYLRLIRGEYACLILASILSLDLSEEAIYFAAYAFVFLASLGVLIARNWTKPEQSWYKGRALAESIKTSCWRYCMRAEPFGDAVNIGVPRAEFRNHLSAILEANRHIGGRLPADSTADGQISTSMESARALDLEDRKAFYDEHRIRDQRKWYATKAGFNKKGSTRWMAIGISSYVLAIFLTLARIAFPQIKIWPIEPLIVIASTIIGWTQVKKYNELAFSYTLTAHEIGILQGRIVEVRTEADFSEFVNDAEQAFSREHTQWAARQQAQ